MLTYCEEKNKIFTLNEYFPFSLDSEHTLLTTRHGRWVILSNDEYNLIKSNTLDQKPELFQKLEEAGIILTKESVKKIIQDLRRENGQIISLPTYHVIDVTNRCNFNCIYCHPDARPEKDDLDENMARKVLDFIFSIPMGHCQIIIQGGEPLLKWDLIKFIYQEAKKRAKEKNMAELRFSITTNLSLMTEEIAKEMAEMKINPAVSFDGPKELHNKHRPFIGGKGSYDAVVYWFQKLKKDYRLKPSFLPLITNISLKYGPRVIVDELLKFGERLVFFKTFRPSGRALAHLKELEMKPEDFFNFWKEGIEYCISLNKKGIKIKERGTVYMVGNILTSHRGSMCQRRPCGAGGFPMLSYGCDGTISACDSVRSIDFLSLGNVNTDNYQTIREKALPLLALAPDLIPICSSCPFMAYCGICLADTAGRENDIYPKIPRSFSCKWQKMAFKYLFKKFLAGGEDAQILRSWIPSFPNSYRKCQT